MKRVIWSDFASETLKEIFTYYKDIAGRNVAKKIKDNIFSSTRQLAKHPESGQIEETLKQLEEGHRYIVRDNYKIVYKLVKEGILITDVFDARQDPIKINNPDRKSEKGA